MSKNYERYIEIATRVLIHIRNREGLDAAMEAASAMIDAASSISEHELRKSGLRAFPDMPKMPNGGPLQMHANGETIFLCRECNSQRRLPPAA